MEVTSNLLPDLSANNNSKKQKQSIIEKKKKKNFGVNILLIYHSVGYACVSTHTHTDNKNLLKQLKKKR